MYATIKDFEKKLKYVTFSMNVLFFHFSETSNFAKAEDVGMAGIFSSSGLLQPFSSVPKQETTVWDHS